MTSMNAVLESRSLIRSRLGAPDVYPQDPKQKEDELNSTNVKHGFINQIPLVVGDVEHASASNYPIDAAKLNDSFNEILRQKQTKNTYSDTTNSVNKKRPGLTKDNFWLVQLAKNRNHVQQWIKELKAGKPLNYLSKRVPIYGKKDDVFQVLAENQITIVRATWYIKMTAQYFVLQADAKNKKNRANVDHNPEWTAAICRFMKDQLARLLDDQSLSNSGMPGIQQQGAEDMERQFEYISKLANYMYAEGMLDRHDFLSWMVETMERLRLHGTFALTYIMPLVMKHIQDIIKNQLLSRRLSFVVCRLLSWLLNESAWGNSTNRSNAIESPSPLSVGPPSVSGQQSQKQHSAPPTPSQASKPLSPQKLGQAISSIAPVTPRTLPSNFPPSLEDIVYGLICILHCITLECPGALVWYPPDDASRILGSPLDYLPAAPSLLPLPYKGDPIVVNDDNTLRYKLREMESDIIQRSSAAEMQWSSDKCQESVTGQTTNRVLSTLEALDKQQNFDRTESIDPIYYKIFVQNNHNKDGNDQQASQAGDEAVIWLLCEWAVSAQRLGEHRASVVAKLLDKRQVLLEQEQVVAAAEKAKTLNSSNPPTSNPGSVGTILSSPPPQLLVEGTEATPVDQAITQQQLMMPLAAPNNIPMFQDLLFNFLDTQAPELVEPSNKKELQSFKNLVMLFSELVQHDVFSHDEYVNTLISKGEITPGVISPLPIFNSVSTTSTNPNTSLGYNNHCSVGVVSVPSVEPRSVGAPVSNKQMDMLAKMDSEDDFPSSARSMDHKMDGDLLCSPIINSDYPPSPFGRSMNERHFTDVMKSMPENPKEKIGNMGSSNMIKKTVGPIWGYGQRRHVQYLMHLPIPFDDDDCIHEMNQRMMVLYGAGRQRNEVKKEIKKITKHVCKLIQKQPTPQMESSYGGPSSVKSAAGSSSKKSKNRSSDSANPNNSSPNALLRRFRCLTYFDQHFVTAQASKAILSSFNDYIADSSSHLPPLSSITLVLNLMEEALNVGGMVQLSVQIASVLDPLEIEISRKHPEKAACYTKDVVLNVVAILRHYQSYLTLDPELTRQAFDGLFSSIKRVNIAFASDCTSSDRCVLMFMYELFTSSKSKYLLESHATNFSNLSVFIKQTFLQSKVAAASNRRYDNSFLLEYIQAPEKLQEAHPLLVAREKSMMLRDGTYKYSFVCTVIISVCTGQHSPESVSSIATLCAEMNARCNDLSSEWLGVLKALCSSSTTFTDVLLYINQSDEAIRDPLALFTAILIARNCLSMENFIREVAIPPLLAACKQPVVDDAEVETGARLICHILLQLFKTPVPPSQASSSDSRSDKPQFYIPEACDRHLLAAAQRNIVVGAVLAVLKLILKLGDASFSGRHSSSPSSNEPGVTAFLAPLSGFDDMNNNFGMPGQSRSNMANNCSLYTPCLSEFAKAAVRTICSQQWVRERCLKNIDWDLWMDKELTQRQMQNLIQYIFCPEEDLQQLSTAPHDQRKYVVQVLNRTSRWTLRQTLLELQIMLKQAAQDQILSDDIAKAIIEVFKNHNTEPTKDRKSPVSGVELDKSNIWLMPHLIKELSSEVQAKVLQEASSILETSQHWSRVKSDRDRSSGRNPASLLSQQPFLSLILTCLKKDQDDQRDALLASLQSQILMFHSEWQQQQRDASSSAKEGGLSQTMVQEALQLRLSLMGGMFDTVQNSSHWTSSVVVLLTQLISSGLVDIEVNAKLFNTVFDMIAVLLHGTLGGDSPNSGEGSKKDYLQIVKKIKKEISDGKATSLKILRRLLPVPRKDTFVITCEHNSSTPGMQISSKQKIVAWDIIEGLKTSSPLSLPWYGICKTERKELAYETQQRYMLFHDHDALQIPLSECLKPPTLPPEEEEEKEEPPKASRKRSTSTKMKSPSASGGASYGQKDSLLPPAKKPRQEKARRKPKKSPDVTAPAFHRNVPTGIFNPNIGQTGMGVIPMQPTTMRSTHLAYSNNQQQYQSYQTHGNPSRTPSHLIPGTKAHSDSKTAILKFLKGRNSGSHSQHYASSNPQMGMNIQHMSQPVEPKSALRMLVDNRRASNMQNDMGQMSYAQRRNNTMAPHMQSTMHMSNVQQHGQMSGYNNYAHQSTGNMNQLHMKNQNYGYQGGVSNQQQSYQQAMPNQSYINQQQPNSSSVAQGYSMGNMQIQGRAMNQPTGYGMSGGMPVQNQSSIMGSQQPPQYTGMINQQQRTMTRLNQQHHMGGGAGQGGMMQMQSMGGAPNAMNPPMGRTTQMVNQGMPSQYVQQQESAQLMPTMRRTMPNQSGMYN